MDDDKEDSETRYVFRGLLALMAFMGIVIPVVILMGHGVSND